MYAHLRTSLAHFLISLCRICHLEGGLQGRWERQLPYERQKPFTVEGYAE